MNSLILVLFILSVISVFLYINKKSNRKNKSLSLSKGQQYQQYLLAEKKRKEKEIAESPDVFTISIPETNEGSGFEYWAAIKNSSKEEIMNVLKGVPWGPMGSNLDEFYVRKDKKISVQKKGLPILSLNQLKHIIANREIWPRYSDLKKSRRF